MAIAQEPTFSLSASPKRTLGKTASLDLDDREVALKELGVPGMTRAGRVRLSDSVTLMVSRR